MHAGVELLGAGAPERHRRGDRGAERGARRGRAQPRRGRARRRRPLPPAARPSSASPTRRGCGSSTAWRRTTSSGSRRRSTGSRASRPMAARPCCACPAFAAAPRSWSEARELGGGAVERAAQRLQATYDALAERGVADRVQLDLSLLRDLGYYTGAILEVYDPALGHILGGGGRYDDLLGRFGRRCPPRASASTSSACTSRRWRRSASPGRRGADDRADGRRADPRPVGRAAEARDPARRAVRRRRSTRSTASGSTPPRCGATRAR